MFQKISASNNPRDMIIKSKHNVIGVGNQTYVTPMTTWIYLLDYCQQIGPSTTAAQIKRRHFTIERQ